MRRRGASPSNTESAAKKGSAETIKTIVPITIRSAEGEVSAPEKKATLGNNKGKEKVGESAAGSELTIEEVYHRGVKLCPLNMRLLSQSRGTRR